LPYEGDEVDQSLIDWYRELSVVERLRAASRSAAWLERVRALRDRGSSEGQ
jgi:hypothetical protein